jgi:glyoxylase-like metal-dependent hydrolase (beta-lactamase superfamily II)
MKLRLFFYALAASASFSQAPARAQQQDYSKVEMKPTKVAGAVHMLEGAGGNIGVSAGPEGVLIVDDQFAPLADKIRAALRAINPGPLRFVLNTHYHGDHTGSNAAFGRESTIIAHDNVRRRLATDQNVLGQIVKASPKEALPVVTFAQSVSLHFNGEEIKVIHFPRGHTDGDSVIFFTGSNVVHMGDHFFNGRFPFVDLAGGGDVEGLIANVGEIIKQVPADVKIIPGHGPLSTLDDLKTYHRTLAATVETVRRQIAQKKTLAQIKTAGLAPELQPWGSGFISTDRWIETVYNSLTRAKPRGAADTKHH